MRKTKASTVLPNLNYLAGFMKEGPDFIFTLAQHAYLLAKGWRPLWQTPAWHPKFSQKYATGHAINSTRYYQGHNFNE